MCCSDRTGREAGWRLMGRVIHDPGMRGRTVAPEAIHLPGGPLEALMEDTDLKAV